MPEKLNAATAVVGIDFGKNSFHVVGLETLVAQARRPPAAGKPAMACAALLADPRLILEPDLDARGRSRRLSP